MLLVMNHITTFEDRNQRSSESEVESYFGASEHIVTALYWPEDVWVILLQCKLTGKAQEACLSLEDGLAYDKVKKSTILRVYELVPEAHSQCFCGLKKVQTQTYIDFAREKSTLFDKWCAAYKADDLASLRELMLLEEFKTCVSDCLAVSLNEQKITSLQQGVMLADEIRFTHKNVLVARDSSPVNRIKTVRHKYTQVCILKMHQA